MLSIKLGGESDDIHVGWYLPEVPSESIPPDFAPAESFTESELAALGVHSFVTITRFETDALRRLGIWI